MMPLCYMAFLYHVSGSVSMGIGDVNCTFVLCINKLVSELGGTSYCNALNCISSVLLLSFLRFL